MTSLPILLALRLLCRIGEPGGVKVHLIKNQHYANMGPQLRLDERSLMWFLGHRSPHGLVRLQSSQEQVLLRQAIALGLVREDGYLTAAGHRFCEERSI